MNIHELKIAPQYFNDVLSGRKKTEVKFNSRNYKIGDILNFNEFDSEINAITGRGCSAQVTCILHGVGLKYGYVTITFKIMAEPESKDLINEIIKESITDYLNQNSRKLLFSQRKALNDYLDSL